MHFTFYLIHSHVQCACHVLVPWYLMLGLIEIVDCHNCNTRIATHMNDKGRNLWHILFFLFSWIPDLWHSHSQSRSNDKFAMQHKEGDLVQIRCIVLKKDSARCTLLLQVTKIIFIQHCSAISIMNNWTWTKFHSISSSIILILHLLE